MTHPLMQRTAHGVVHSETYRRQQVLGELIGACLATLWLWAARRRPRSALGTLISDAHVLADIGLDRERAWRAAPKPFWQS